MTEAAPLSPAAPERRANFQRIQILRFLAAFAVILFHANGTAPSYVAGKNSDILVSGYLGVDIFFVISGFIICYISRTREADWRTFLVRRIERIVPLYWLFTLVTFALISFAHVARSGPMDPMMLLRSLLFVQWSAVPSAYPVVFVGWSLEFEMFFYLAFTAALVWTRRPADVVAVLLSAVVTAGNLFWPHAALAPTGFFVNPMILEFVLGIVIAQGYCDRRINPWVAAIVVVALITTALVPWGQRVWIGGVPGAALVVTALWLDRRFPLRHSLWRGAVRLGDASYSLYLAQALAISAAGRFVARFWPTIGTTGAIMLLSLSALTIGYLCHLLVERPVARMLRRVSGAAGRAN